MNFTFLKYNRQVRVKQERNEQSVYLVIDIGSNTIRAVVFRIEDGVPVAVLNKKYSAGLSGYIEESNMSREGIEKCTEVLSEIRLIIDAFTFKGVYAFATAAVRNIDNSAEVIAAVRNKCGIEIQILSGEEEAYYDYCGAMRILGDELGILTDVGGGSTEFVCYEKKQIFSSSSLQFGSLNLFNRYVQELIPSEEELRAIEKEVKKSLKNEGLLHRFPEGKAPAIMCAVGGSARAVQKLYYAMYPSEKTEKNYSRAFLKELLSKADDRKVLTMLLKTAPERIHTFFPGAAVIYAAAKYFDTETISTAPTGVREGYLYSRLKKEGVILE